MCAMSEIISLKSKLLLILGPPAHIDETIFYIKLDFIGVKYMEQYKDKSSQEFKRMAGDIEQEVKSGLFFCQTKSISKMKK